jgi:hypothetical protein
VVLLVVVGVGVHQGQPVPAAAALQEVMGVYTVEVAGLVTVLTVKVLMAQFVLSGPAQHAHSPQPAQQTNNSWSNK